MKLIPVTCVLLIHQGKVLAAQRSDSMTLPSKWEFPGGKVEEGEAAAQCLIREIKEELAIEIEVQLALPVFDHSYHSDATIRLMPFLSSWTAGKMTLLEHASVCWLGQRDLFSLDWAAADVPIVHYLHDNWVKLVYKSNL